jgi:hypothetical protein
MSETTFPRRDGDGRVVRLADLLASVAAGLVLGMAALLVIDGLSALVGLGRFGEISGWLAAILPVWLFTEEFRAWRVVPSRIALALLSGVLAAVLAMGAASAVAGMTALPPLGSGAVGAATGSLVYASLWYVGIRWLADRGVSR